jgi:uncharacterized protein YpmB
VVSILNNQKKWLFWFIVGFLVLFFSSVLYYHHIQSPFEKMRQRAIQLVKEDGTITKVDKVSFSAYEKKHVIVFGRDEDNQKMIAWVTGKEVYVESLENGISKLRVKQIVKMLYPNAVILHVVPNIWRDEYVWEIMYKDTHASNALSYYRYYRFSDGKLLAYYALHR